MPCPDPDAIDYGDTWPDRPAVQVSHSAATILGGGNPRHRLDRAKRIFRKLASWRGWACRWCGGQVPLFRRADAIYCSESCRKRAAQKRRKGQAWDNPKLTC